MTLKVTTVVRVLVSTGTAVTRTAPTMAAVRSMPALRFCWMASLMTMALSTRMPRLTMRAAMETNWNSSPSAHMTIKVMRMLMGSATLMTSALRSCTPTSTTTMMSSTLSRRFTIKPLMLLSMASGAYITSWKARPAGSPARRSSRVLRRLRPTLTALRPSSMRPTSSTASWPSCR